MTKALTCPHCKGKIYSIYYSTSFGAKGISDIKYCPDCKHFFTVKITIKEMKKK